MSRWLALQLKVAAVILTEINVYALTVSRSIITDFLGWTLSIFKEEFYKGAMWKLVWSVLRLCNSF